MDTMELIIDSLMMFGTVGALWMLIWQSKRTKKIEEYKFLLDVEMYFSKNTDIQRIHKKFLCEEKGIVSRSKLTSDDIEYISAYFTFFETFYPLIKSGLLKYEDIDNRFGYRFFIAMHNVFAQDEEVFRDIEHYGNLVELYNSWYKHRHDKGMAIPLEENHFTVDSSGIRRNGVLVDVKSKTRTLPSGHKIRHCDKTNLTDIITVQETVLAGLQNDTLFIGTSVSDINQYLIDPSSVITLGVFEENALCAYLVVILTHNHSESLYKHIKDIRNHKSNRRVATLDTVAVLPQHRGKGYQRLLTEEACKLAKSKGYDYMVTSVSPFNFVSVSNMTREKFIVHKNVTLHGKKRIVLYRKL